MFYLGTYFYFYNFYLHDFCCSGSFTLFFCIQAVCSVFLNSNIKLCIVLDNSILIFYKNSSTELYEWHKLIDSISICYSLTLI